MAEKIFTNVRLGLKVDTLTNWESSSLVLKRGEVAFATVAASAGTGLTEPVCMMKIGDGEHTFSELEFDFYAKASDVLAACKSEASLKAFVNGVIADAGIASSDAMEALAGRVTTAEGKVATLEGKMTAVEGKAAANETAIGALEDLVGDTAVATQISNAIAELDLANTYEAKGEAAKVQSALDTYKTSNDAAVQKNATDIAGEIARAKAAEEANAGAISAIKDGTTIDSFADVEAALAGKQATGDYATKTEAQAMADGKDAAIAEAKKAGTDAMAAAEAAQADVDAVEALVGDTAVATQISDAITELDLANTYAPKEHTHTKSEITDFAHNHEMSEVNGLVAALEGKQAKGDYATKTEAQGYADAKDEAIAAAKKAGDDAQADVDALETYVGTIPSDEKYADITNVIGFINKKAEETLAAASGNSTETAASVKAALDTYKSENDAAVKANKDAIDALEELVGDTKVADQITTAVAAEKERAEGIEGGLETRLKAVEDDHLVAADKTELTQAIATAKQEAIATVLGEGTDEDFDTLKEVADWILSDTTGAAALQTDVATIKADYLKGADKTELSGAISAEETRAKGVEGGLETRLAAVEADHLVGADKTALQNAIDAKAAQTELDAAEERIGALETKVGDTDVATQISEAVAAEAEIARAAEKANADAIDALKAKAPTWDAAVQTVTAGTGLTATKTGTDVAIAFDDSVTFIFDCGTSAE